MANTQLASTHICNWLQLQLCPVLPASPSSHLHSREASWEQFFPIPLTDWFLLFNKNTTLLWECFGNKGWDLKNWQQHHIELANYTTSLTTHEALQSRPRFHLWALKLYQNSQEEGRSTSPRVPQDGSWGFETVLLPSSAAGSMDDVWNARPCQLMARTNSCSFPLLSFLNGLHCHWYANAKEKHSSRPAAKHAWRRANGFRHHAASQPFA